MHNETDKKNENRKCFLRLAHNRTSAENREFLRDPVSEILRRNPRGTFPAPDKSRSQRSPKTGKGKESPINMNIQFEAMKDRLKIAETRLAELEQNLAEINLSAVLIRVKIGALILISLSVSAALIAPAFLNK